MVRPGTGIIVFHDGESWLREGAVSDIGTRTQDGIDLFWIKNESIADLDNLQAPDIIENLAASMI